MKVPKTTCTKSKKQTEKQNELIAPPIDRERKVATVMRKKHAEEEAAKWSLPSEVIDVEEAAPPTKSQKTTPSSTPSDPAPSDPPAAGVNFVGSDIPSSSSVEPWTHRMVKTNDMPILVDDSILEDKEATRAFLKGMWPPKDEKMMMDVSVGSLLDSCPELALKNMFEVMAMCKLVEQAIVRMKKTDAQIRRVESDFRAAMHEANTEKLKSKALWAENEQLKSQLEGLVKEKEEAELQRALVESKASESELNVKSLQDRLLKLEKGAKAMFFRLSRTVQIRNAEAYRSGFDDATTPVGERAYPDGPAEYDREMDLSGPPYQDPDEGDEEKEISAIFAIEAPEASVPGMVDVSDAPSVSAPLSRDT